MVFVGFVRISDLIWYATRYCEQSGSDSTGQNVKHYLMNFLSAKFLFQANIYATISLEVFTLEKHDYTF